MKNFILFILLFTSILAVGQEVKRPSTTTINQNFTVYGGSEVHGDTIIGVTDTIFMKDYAPIEDTTAFTIVGDSAVSKKNWIVGDTIFGNEVWGIKGSFENATGDSLIYNNVILDDLEVIEGIETPLITATQGTFTTVDSDTLNALIGDITELSVDTGDMNVITITDLTVENPFAIVTGDTATAPAVLGKILFMAADSSYYGCRSTVASKKWYKLHQ